MFIIARVRPHGGGDARYRCVGAMYNHWCYGSLPVKGAHRMVTLLKQESNAQIVREELRSIEGKYGAEGTQEPVIPRVPCPYTLFLLNLAFNADLDESSISLSGRYFSGGSHKNILHASMGCWDEDNDEGLSIFDVTDPTRPRYCFLPGHSTPTKSPRMVPLSAASYLWAYYKAERKDPASVQRKHCKDLIALMQEVPVIDEDDIAEAWPDEAVEYEYGDDDGEEDEVVSDQEEADNDGQGVEAGSGPVEETDGGSPEIPSLASLTLEPSVKQALETGEEGIVPILLQANKLPKLLEAARELGAPFPDIALPVLARYIEVAGSVINLSELQLSGEDLVKLVPADASLDALNLTGNTALTGDGLRTLLAAKRMIRRLVLIRTGVTDADLTALLDTPALFGHIEELIHPLLYSWRQHAYYPCAFAIHYVSGMSESYGSQGMVTIPLLSLRQVAQNLRLLVDAALEDNYQQFARGDAGLEAVISAGVLPAGKAWGERAVWCTPTMANLPSTGMWMFLMDEPNTVFRRGDCRFGFVRCGGAPPREDGGRVTKFSLQGFLEQLEKDGYLPPSADTVAQLQAVFEKLEKHGATQMLG